jgi:hypothetical protein
MSGYLNEVLGKFKKTLWFSFMAENYEAVKAELLVAEDLMG